MCIDFDNNVVPESERAKTKVLSTQSDDLLKECWMRWRLSAPYRSILYLETVKARFDNGELEFDDVKDAIKGVDKVIKEVDISTWAINDVSLDCLPLYTLRLIRATVISKHQIHCSVKAWLGYLKDSIIRYYVLSQTLSQSTGR
jgi:hypothetical protein